MHVVHGKEIIMITIYSKNGCPQCETAKSLLNSYGLEYNEIRIDQVDQAREFLLKKGHRSVPQFYIGDEILLKDGFLELQTHTKQTLEKLIEDLK